VGVGWGARVGGGGLGGCAGGGGGGGGWLGGWGGGGGEGGFPLGVFEKVMGLLFSFITGMGIIVGVRGPSSCFPRGRKTSRVVGHGDRLRVRTLWGGKGGLGYLSSIRGIYRNILIKKRYQHSKRAGPPLLLPWEAVERRGFPHPTKETEKKFRES